MRISLFILLFFTNPTIFTQAQTPGVAWQRLFSGHEGDYANKIIATKDNGSLIVGRTESGGRDIHGSYSMAQADDIVVIKLSADGTMDWQRCLGGAGNDFGTSAVETDDGYLILGHTASLECRLPASRGSSDLYLIKLNKSGDIIWEKRHGGEKPETASAITADASGNIYLAGLSQSSEGDLSKNQGGSDCWVIKVSPAGNIIWQKSFGGSAADEPTSICVANDGVVLVTGSTGRANGDFFGGKGNVDAFVARLSANTGNIEWIRIYGGTDFDMFSSIIQLQNNSFMLGGRSASKDGDLSGLNTNAHGLDAWLMNINANGDINWKKIFAGESDDLIHELNPVGVSSVLGTGYRSMELGNTCSYGRTSGIWVFRLSNEGNLLWEKKIADKQNSSQTSASIASDFSVLIATTTNSSDIPGYYGNSSGQGASATDIWAIRLQGETYAGPNVFHPSFEIEKPTANICEGRAATITTKTLNTGTRPKYRWKRNGTDVPGLFSTSLTAADFKNGEIISCTVSSDDNCESTPFSITDQVKISFKNKTATPEIRVTVNTEFVCGCTEFRFKAHITNAGNKPSWQWYRNNIAVGYDQDEYISKDLVPGDIIRCEFFDRDGCSSISPVSSNLVSIKDNGDILIPEVSISSLSQSPCRGKPVTLAAKHVSAGMYPLMDWRKNGQSLGLSNDTITLFDLKPADIIVCMLTPDTSQACIPRDVITSNALTINFSAGNVEPRLELQTLSDTVCAGGKTIIRALATDAGNRPGFRWSLNGLDVGDNSDSLILSSVNNLDRIDCKIYVDKSEICPTKDSVEAVSKILYTWKDSDLSVVINAIKNDVCAGEPVIFSATHTNAGANPRINWFVNNVLHTQNNPAFSYTGAKHGDLIHFTLKPDAGGCDFDDLFSQQVAAVIHDTTVVHIYPADTTIKAGQSVQFRVELSNPVQSFVWSPASLLVNSQELQPQTTILHDETIFNLTLTNAAGCRSGNKARIKIVQPFYMPNAFTPNGDGLNDIYRIPEKSGSGIKQFSIYNRWGQLIFRTNQVLTGWDGNIKGLPASPGAYTYIISGENANGPVQYRGSFVLIR